MENKKISIIIPMRNEEKYIENCLNSIFSSDHPLDLIEILIINSMSNDDSVNIVQKYIEKHDFIFLYHNPQIYTPFAFNLGVTKATGDYIFIISAHCQYAKNYFSTLVKYAIKLKADSVGAISKTEVLNKNSKSNSIKEVLSHRLGVGNSYFRIGTDKIMEVDAISGCYDKKVFENLGLYNEKLIRNQDIELNKRIKNSGGKLFLIPFTSYTYYTRENFSDLAKNNFGNGKWNILTAYYTKTLNSLSLRHFVPLMFLLSLLLPLLLALFSLKFAYLTLLSLFSYLALVIIISLKLRDESNSFLYLIGSFLTLHLSYGFGSLVGIFSIIKKYIKGEK